MEIAIDLTVDSDHRWLPDGIPYAAVTGSIDFDLLYLWNRLSEEQRAAFSRLSVF